MEKFKLGKIISSYVIAEIMCNGFNIEVNDLLWHSSALTRKFVIEKLK